jgi:DNA-binding GntR family transcriptional regulator
MLTYEPNKPASVVDTVRNLIIAGRYAPGERINEVHLARDLGLSRTPVREGLMLLVSEGALTVRPRYGFYVAELSLEELEQLYPIRALLGPEALRLAGLPSAQTLQHLESLNKKISRTTNPETVVELDDEWHMELLAACPNRVLVELIRQLMRRTRRYELALFRETKNVHRATEDHDGVLAALRARDLGRACAALRRNMESGKAPIAAWLRQRQAKQAGD